MIFSILLIFLLVTGTGIGFALGIPVLVYILFYTDDVSFIVLPQKIFNGIDSYPLLAIPFFLLAAEMMTKAGLTRRIIDIFNALFGWIRGGLAVTNVGVSMFFAGMSGAAVADATSIGAVLIPAMNEEGYDPPFSAAVTASSAICGPIIPPSIPFIIYGVVAKVSIFGLFLGGAIPGVILGLALSLITYIISRYRKYPRYRLLPISDIFRILRKGFWALMMPVILVGGIIAGVFTITELSAVSAVYAFIVGFFIYRDLKVSQFLDMFTRVVIDSSVIMIIIGLSNLFAFALTIQHIPEVVSVFVSSITSNKVILLVLINLLILASGMFLDSTPATIILVPILLPVVQSLGISPLHFGVILVFNLMMGCLTPPVAMTLLIATKIARCNIIDTMRECGWFFLVLVVILVSITFYAPLSEFLPNLILNR